MNTATIEFNKYELKFMGDMINALRLCYGCGVELKIRKSEEVAKACELILEKLENAERLLREEESNNE